MNVENRTLFIADNLDIMRRMESETIDLIYLDPPFNSNRNYKSPIESDAGGAGFKDIWTDADVEDEWHGEIAKKNADLYQAIQAIETMHSKGMKYYITGMAVRIFEMHRILKKTGSTYIHCDPHASHYIKIVMDSLFGRNNFQNEIIWKRFHHHTSTKRFGRIHETLLFYTKSNKAKWNIEHQKHDESYIKKYYTNKDNHGIYRTASLTAAGVNNGESGKPWRNIDPKEIGHSWAAPRTGGYAKYIEENFIPNYRKILKARERLEALDKAGLIYWPKKGKMPAIKRYLKANKGKFPQDIITDIKNLTKKSAEQTSYPTQKPTELLHRIIKASSNPGDIILDPFCGCATTLIAAEQLGRQWVGIDISSKAQGLLEKRLKKETELSTINPDHPDWFRTIQDIKVETQQTLPKPPEPKNNPNDYRKYKDELFGKQQGRCNGCELRFHYENLTVDHIVPKAMTGGIYNNDPSNLQLLCAHCNSTKGTGTQEQMYERLRKKGVRK